MFKNKKGFSEDMIVAIFFIMLLIPIYISLDTSIESSIKTPLTTTDMESSLLYDRLTSSENSIFYVDEEIGRVYSWKIQEEDIESRFTEETLNRLFDKDKNSDIAFKLHLKNGDIDKVIYFKKELFEIGEPLVGIEGSRYSLSINPLPVSIVSPEGAEKQATLTVYRVVSK